MLKKLICSLVSIALIVSCTILFAFRGSNSFVYVGTRPNEKIENMGELYDVTNFILTDLDSGSLKNDSKYESATVHISLSETIKASQKTNSAKVKGKTTIEQDATFYLTKEGIYIEAQIAVFVSATNNTSDVRNFAKIDINIYLTQQKSYVKIIDYTVLTDENSVLLNPEYANRWIEAPRNVVLGFLPLEIELEFVLDVLSEMLDALFESGHINENDTTASFDEQDLAGIEIWDLEDMQFDADFIFDDYKENLKIDFTDKTTTYISMSASCKGKDVGVTESSGWFGSKSEKLTTDIRFKGVMDVVISHVNNTVIGWSLDTSKIDISIDSREELEKLFVIKEYKEEK